MKKINNFKKVFLFIMLFTFSLLFSKNLVNVNADTSSDNGLTFETDIRYKVEKKLSTLPQTIEAEINLPTSYSARAGVIFGNWGMGASWSFEINSDGKPRFFFTDNLGEDKSLIFNADVRKNSGWTHLSITHDSENKIINCYIDGALVASQTYYGYATGIVNNPFVLGGDNRSGNEQYFKGSIRSVTAYSDVRSGSEIASDMTNGVDLDDENLLLAYSVSSNDLGQEIKDLGKNGYDIHCERTWFTEKEPVSDYAYSFAVVGDTQILAEKYPTDMPKIYDWIVENKESKKIEYVFGLGDITNGNSQAEWTIAKNAVSKLNGVVPYSLVRGNHDSSAKLNNTFNHEDYTSQFEGFYQEGYIDSSYRTISIGTVDYLMITLNYGASDAELEWAGALCEAYPNHKVIITTHCYMFRDGTTLGSNDVCPPADSNDANSSPTLIYNNGEQMWKKLVSKYGNIFLVLSGHDPCENVVTLQSQGVHGNTVTQMLIDPQGMDAAMGATGMVCMLYFSKDGSQIDVEWYSTVREKYFKESNQYDINISNEKVDAHKYVTLHDEQYHWCECSVCDSNVVVNKELHHFEDVKVLKESTCISTGEMLMKCSGCEQETTKEIPVVGHSYTKFVSNNDASCFKDGTKTALCDHEGCNKTLTILDEGTKLTNHNYLYHFDSTHHWLECSICGEKEQKENHLWNAKEETSEMIIHKCECNAQYAVKLEEKNDNTLTIILFALGAILPIGALLISKGKKKGV